MSLKYGLNFLFEEILVSLLQVVREKWEIYKDFLGHTTSYAVMFQFTLKNFNFFSLKHKDWQDPFFCNYSGTTFFDIWIQPAFF